jgi:hypothetical protein
MCTIYTYIEPHNVGNSSLKTFSAKKIIVNSVSKEEKK